MGVWNDFWKNRSLSNVIPNLKKTGKTISREAGHLKDAFAEEASDMYNYGPISNLIMDVADELEPGGLKKNKDLLNEAYKETFEDIGTDITDAYDEHGLLGVVGEAAMIPIGGIVDPAVAAAANQYADILPEVSGSMEDQFDSVKASRDEEVGKTYQRIEDKVLDAVGEDNDLLSGVGTLLYEAAATPVRGVQMLKDVILNPEKAHQDYSDYDSIDESVIGPKKEQEFIDKANALSEKNKNEALAAMYQMWNMEQRQKADADRRDRLLEFKKVLTEREKATPFQYDLVGY